MAELFEKDQVVSGITFFDGNIDGKALNSGTIYILNELDTSRDNSKGSRTVETKCDSSEVVKRLMHLEFPLKCKVTYELRVTKAAEKMVVVDCKPLGSARIPVDDHHKKAA